VNRLSLVAALTLTAFLGATPSAFAAGHFWQLVSPNHEQTFAYGTETNRVWTAWGRDRHLALLLDYTNDPFVDRQNPRQYDNFRFDFLSVRLGADNRTFYYHAAVRAVPVAVKHAGFLGIDEVRLLPNASVVVTTPHGFITVYLNLLDAEQLSQK
jgi:hypothetical protein